MPAIRETIVVAAHAEAQTVIRTKAMIAATTVAEIARRVAVETAIVPRNSALKRLVQPAFIRR